MPGNFIAIQVAPMFAYCNMVTATKRLREKFISGHITLRNVSCKLCCNDGTKLRDKLPSVTIPLRMHMRLYKLFFGKVFAVIFGAVISSATGRRRFALQAKARIKEPVGSLVRIHDCNQTTGQCKASASSAFETDKSAGT